MWSVRSQLCELVVERKQELKKTYDQLSDLSGLNKTQLARILRHKGEGVSIENIEYLLKCMGVRIEVHEYKEDTSDICNS